MIFSNKGATHRNFIEKFGKKFLGAKELRKLLNVLKLGEIKVSKVMGCGGGREQGRESLELKDSVLFLHAFYAGGFDFSLWIA